MINFKIGILGAGNIAAKIAETLEQLDSFEVYAIASRDTDKANSFGDKYSVEKRYGSYAELISDPDVELIYIATPHSNHVELAKQCIEAGKPCLVEKAFSYNATTAEEVLKLSEEKGVFCGEAMWIRFMPVYRFIYEKLREGIIGEPQQISCSIGYDLRGKERLAKPELAGGALLDLGVYPLNLFSIVFEAQPENTIASCLKLPNGVEAQISLNMTFPKGKTANALITMLYGTGNEGRIFGNKGYMVIDNINCPNEVKIFSGDNKQLADLKVNDRQISGYEYEFIAARDAVITGKYESPAMPHSETIRILKICDNIRNACGIKFPME